MNGDLVFQGVAFELLSRIYRSSSDVFCKANQLSLQFTKDSQTEIILQSELTEEQINNLYGIIISFKIINSTENLALIRVSKNVWVIR